MFVFITEKYEQSKKKLVKLLTTSASKGTATQRFMERRRGCYDQKSSGTL